LVVYS